MSINFIRDIENTTQYDFGTEGFDVFLIKGPASAYCMDATTDGGFVVWHKQTGAFDILYNVEKVQFDDLAFSFSDGDFSQCVVHEVPSETNEAPIAVHDMVTATVGEKSNFDLLKNDSDPDADSISITQINGIDMKPGWSTWVEGVGLVSLEEDGTVGVKPSGPGAFEFSYTIADGNGGTSTAKVCGLGESPANNLPQAIDDFVTGTVGEPIVMDILANDTDLDGGILVVTSIGGREINLGWKQYVPGTGVVTYNQDGTLTLKPDAGVTSIDLEYTISDGDGGTSSARITGTLEDGCVVNTTMAEDDTATTTSGTPLLIDVLANDTDPEGHSQSITTFTNGENGTVTLVNGKLEYTPLNNFVGHDSFQYNIVDSEGAVSTATVKVSVDAPANNAPVAKDDTDSTESGVPVDISVLNNDTDPDGDTLSVLTYTSAESGSLKLENNVFTYTPNSDFTGIETFSYVIEDGNGGSDTAVVTVNVKEGVPENTTIANADSVTTDFGTAIDIDVLANDTDLEGHNQSIDGFSNGQNGTVHESNGKLIYTPNQGFSGTDSFQYTVIDSEGAVDTATVKVEVSEATEIVASIVGAGTLWEGEEGSYRVQLDKAVTEDTVFTLQVFNGTAIRVDSNTGAVTAQDIMHGGYFDTRYGVGGELAGIYDDKVAFYNPDGSWSYRDQVGQDGITSWDFTVEQQGDVQHGGVVQVLVKAGETLSEAFEIQTWNENVTVDRDSDFTRNNPEYAEGTENFSIEISSYSTSSADQISFDAPKNVDIVDETDYQFVSPIGLDLNQDGKIGVTGETSSRNKDADAELGRMVEFDIDADGKLDTIEWFDGSGDGILVDIDKIGADGSIDGSALFGDQGGTYADGYEKLSLKDSDGDGQISGDELANLGLWIDDGDSILEEGELTTVQEQGIASISTVMEFTLDENGRELIQSTSTTVDVIEILSEDVWFATADDAGFETEEPDDHLSHEDEASFG